MPQEEEIINQRYLGDGVYIGIDKHRNMFVMFTSNGVINTDHIYIDNLNMAKSVVKYIEQYDNRQL